MVNMIDLLITVLTANIVVVPGATLLQFNTIELILIAGGGGGNTTEFDVIA